MTRRTKATVRDAVRGGLGLGVAASALVTSFLLAMWLSRTFSPGGDWLQTTVTGFGYPIAWLLLTLLYASGLSALVDRFFVLLWPKPREPDRE